MLDSRKDACEKERKEKKGEKKRKRKSVKGCEKEKGNKRIGKWVEGENKDLSDFWCLITSSRRGIRLWASLW